MSWFLTITFWTGRQTGDAEEHHGVNSVQLISMTEDKPLKKYRSHAERIAMWQRNIQILLTILVVVLDILLALRAFHFI